VSTYNVTITGTVDTSLPESAINMEQVVTNLLRDFTTSSAIPPNATITIDTVTAEVVR
jgi:hypothetical protein